MIRNLTLFCMIASQVHSLQAGRLLLYTFLTDSRPSHTILETTTLGQSITIQAAQAVGRYTWLIQISSQNYIRISPSHKTELDNLSVRYLKKEAKSCKLREKVAYSSSIVPDSAWSHHNPSNGRLPHNARSSFQAGWLCKSQPCWFQVDLGSVFHLYRIGTRSGAIPGLARYLFTFQFQHRLVNSELIPYKEDNITKIFNSHVGGRPEWRTLVFNELRTPVYGQIFRVEPLTGQAPIGISVLFSGCDVNTVRNKPIMKTGFEAILQDVIEVNDNNTNTCVTVPANDPSTIMIPILDAQNDSMTVTLFTHHDESCSSYSDKDIYAMVKDFPPFRTNTEGAFAKCEPLDAYIESTFYIQQFNCICEYGTCEDLYVRIFSQCEIQLCDTEVYTYSSEQF